MKRPEGGTRVKTSKNEEGYALLIVLLMVVLFLGLSATFMAGSINHAKQERMVDTSNQSVASAEMGVKYYSADLQREIRVVKAEIIELTQDRLKAIVECFRSGNPGCDEPTELKARENLVDSDMKTEYIKRIKTKVEELEESEVQKTPFPGEDVHYAIVGTTITELNSEKKDISLSSTSDKIINWLRIELELEGDSKGVTKYLTGIFTVEVPETFLSEDESLTIETTTINNSNLKYDDIFTKEWPKMMCSELINGLESGIMPVQNECLLGSNMSAEKFVELLKSKKLEPKNFRVFTSNYQTDVCNNSCNNLSFDSLGIVVKGSDDVLKGAEVTNSNSLNNLNLIVDGHFTVKNMNSLGKKSNPQTLIFRELTVTSNVQGQGITGTNLVILGKAYADGNKSADSRMDFQKNITIGDNGRICFDFDRILPADIKDLSESVKFSNNNTTGQIIYYTSDLNKNKFVLSNGATSGNTQRTLPYVTGYDNYTDFLSSCGVDVSKVVTSTLEIPYAYVIDPSFGLEVEY